jgi:drug/metabolite transporter (DMT)-like permease
VSGPDGAAGPGLALLSSGLWGSADFFGGLMSRRLPSMAVVAWSQGSGLLLGLVVATATGAWSDPPGWLPWAVLAGASGALGLIAFYAALAAGTMGVVSPIAALGAVVPVLAGVLSGEQPTALQSLGIVVALLGAVLASGPELRGGGGDPAAARRRARAVLLAALAAVAFGVALLAIGRGAEHSTVLTLVGMRCTSVTAFVVVALALRSVGGVRPRDLPALAAVGACDLSANLAFGFASTLGLLSVTAVLGSLYPVATVLLARFVLHERLLAVQWAGVGAALAGVALIAS